MGTIIQRGTARLLDREDCADVLWLIQQHCQLEMENMMDILNGEKHHLNRHKVKGELQELFYNYLIKEVENYALESCEELLQYASWMSE